MVYGFGDVSSLLNFIYLMLFGLLAYIHAHRYKEISNQSIWALRARIWGSLHA